MSTLCGTHTSLVVSTHLVQTLYSLSEALFPPGARLFSLSRQGRRRRMMIVRMRRRRRRRRKVLGWACVGG
jgi:hypothetical protein